MTPPLTVYTYAKCSTCRDATRWLRERGVAFVEKAIRETPPSRDELKQVLAAYDGHIRRLFNTSGMDYGAQGLAEKLPRLPEAEALKLLANDGRLVKRPFVVGPGVALAGFDPAKWETALG